MTDTLTASTPPAALIADAWTNLEDHCAGALSVSRELLRRIESGAEATDLLPLLQQERDAEASARAGIAHFEGKLPADGAPRRNEIAAQLAELVQLYRLSRDLLSRRGVRLRTPYQRAQGQRFAATQVPVQREKA
jgi:hypothetical protein